MRKDIGILLGPSAAIPNPCVRHELVSAGLATKQDDILANWIVDRDCTDARTRSDLIRRRPIRGPARPCVSVNLGSVGAHTAK